MTYEKMLKQSSKLYNLYLEKLAGLYPVYSEEEFVKKCKIFHGKLPILTSTDLFRRRFMSLLVYDISLMLPDIVERYSSGSDKSNKSVLKLVNDNVTKAVASVIARDDNFNIHLISLIRFMISGAATAAHGEEFARIAGNFIDSYNKSIDEVTLIRMMSELITFMMTSGKSHGGIKGFDTKYNLIYRAIGIQVIGSVSDMGSNLYDNFLMCNPRISSYMSMENDADTVGITCVKLFEFIFGVNLSDRIEKAVA